MIKRKIVYLSSGWFHPSLLARFRVSRFLSGLESIDLVKGSFPGDLDLLKDAHGAVLFYHKKKLPPGVVKTLVNFAQSKGILGIHSVTASAKGSHEYASLWGGAFAGHGKPGPLRLTGAGSGLNPVLGNKDSFEINDELYHHNFTLGSLDILYNGEQNGVAVPLVWRKIFPPGGRLCYIGWGHYSAVFYHAECLRIMKACFEWTFLHEEEATV